jgi:hypothetical protein
VEEEEEEEEEERRKQRTNLCSAVENEEVHGC